MKIYAAVLSSIVVVFAGASVGYPVCLIYCDGNSLVEEGYRALWEDPTSPRLATSVEDFRLGLSRNVASPYRWCDLGEALMLSGDEQAARYCFRRAVVLSPNTPPILLRVANFYLVAQHPKQALEILSRILEKGSYDEIIFNYYDRFGFDTAEIFSQGIPTARVAQSWLLHLMEQRQTTTIDSLWRWMTSRKWADDITAGKYLQSLLDQRQYDAASKAWSLYKTSGKKDIGDSVTNGDFEQEPGSLIFDWKIAAISGVQVARDSTISHSGSWSLRIQFEGTTNMDYHSISQSMVVAPGTYLFQAFVKTQAVSTDQGVGFRIVDPKSPKLLDILTENVNGTSDWRSIQRTVAIAQSTGIVEIQLIRKPSLQFENAVSGTVWIDSVRFVPVKH